ncbi:deoxyguanosinetriphosphate triphosphohydrolase [Candidatus Neoehrlichia procyonis]|uniref:Deoxyguanosinetriphosphate triphosphohydrolase-like protein n=1 Tax=Candidatus Neoehrlichia procyonis str. RAC413 TaxID=1359163 RepID=A0A0F3NLI2_9RICK|nr:deoxyguanosinetriphosphate triphosphohydrolase [Candidatus Neoehrlichia lotoris]KJV68905.1 dGTPase family protein [Candidatus Neoehrlichia lotoris str. RAC413]
MSNNIDMISYASHPLYTRGRVYKESEDKYRSCYQRDRDRIIYSTAFRKLQYKTQVFLNYHIGDYHRTRLTHSLEVAQIARSLSRRLKLNEDLAEAISLAHDLGHAPFGHTGEEALNFIEENDFKFDHNVQALRILVLLEKKYIKFDGLNLSWEMIEGLVKHNGPLNIIDQNKDIHEFIMECDSIYNLELNKFPTLEAQIASISDDIAYIMHDIDDGLRENILIIEELLTLPLIGRILKNNIDANKDYPRKYIIHESLRKFYSMMIDNVGLQVENNLKKYNIVDQHDIKNSDIPLVNFSLEFDLYVKDIKSFLKRRLYRHDEVNKVRDKVQYIIQNLFKAYYQEISYLPLDWQDKILMYGELKRYKSMVLCDFISGMTDRFAIQEHERIYGSTVI